jgi:hypothetical protein
VKRKITALMLSDMFDESRIVRSSWKKPNHTALEQLAGELDLLRHSYFFGSLLAKDARKQLQDALEVALEALPGVIESSEKCAEYYRDHGWDDTSAIEEGNKARRLEEAILAFAPPPSNIDLALFPQLKDYKPPRLCVEHRVVPDAERWHKFAEVLVKFFRTAMRSTNDNQTIELSNKGPVSRFLEAVIPLVSGEEPNGETVVRYIQRERTRVEEVAG